MDLILPCTAAALWFYTGKRPIYPPMQSCWFGDVSEGRCLPFTGDTAALVSRILALREQTGTVLLPDWEEAVSCGFCSDRAEYLARLQTLCIAAAERSVREHYSGKDAELLQMVRTLDEMDAVINLLSERAADWYMVKQPSFSRKYRRIPAHTLIRTMQEKSRGALGKVAGEIGQLAETRTALAKEVSARANDVMPNTSALIGGLVAARLMAHAGGLLPLSRLPASAIQVLGARTALFAHLRNRTPSPKHGIIFQHRRVHNAPRDVRGRVARVLASKLAIAARLDYFRGSADQEFLKKAQVQIDAAGRGDSK